MAIVTYALSITIYALLANKMCITLTLIFRTTKGKCKYSTWNSIQQFHFDGKSHICLMSPFTRYFNSNYVKCKDANWKSRCDFLFDDNSNVCPISHLLWGICKSNRGPKVWHWKGMSLSRKRKKLDLCHSTWNSRFHIRDFFQNFIYPTTYVYTNGNPGTLIHSVGNSLSRNLHCIIDLPKSVIATDTRTFKLK